ncbi:MAG: DGQHR domain-containing protein [Alteromonas stellipolaris]|uniref:DGQHR domain-containing protein n=1 Tax=Alteromonas stellipolaris TaxID=233316 RepID=UPI003B8DAB45
MQCDLTGQSNIMTSPCGDHLSLVLFKGNEGIGNLGVTTYEGMMTFGELAKHTRIEQNSDELDESLKCQRDVDNARVNGLKTYWENSKGTVFPNLTLFVNELDVNKTFSVAGRNMVEAIVDAGADRFISDGQGRTTFIKWLVAQPEGEQFAGHTISFKLIVTHTKSLRTEKAMTIMKQVFADYHVKLKKPNKSISKHFNTSCQLTRLTNELIDALPESANGRIALHGKITKGKLWTYDQFATLIQRFLKITPSKASTILSDEASYKAIYADCLAFITQAMQVLPLKLLDDETVSHDKLMFTRAIFASALGYVGRSLYDEMLGSDSMDPTWHKLVALDMPIEDIKAKFWTEKKITFVDGDSIKVIKATDKRIGSLICQSMKIWPCPELMQ